mmetsp:Transcript_137007/g.309461  ORF Transcript_137007/g.309461 Transcript_137007/m.309461 type:complete len:360 (+) Transcript_137007:146-1225(+)
MCRPPSLHAPKRMSPVLLMDEPLDASAAIINRVDEKAHPSSSKRQVCPEFLRKLVDMLKDTSNSSIIEWKNNKIHVYNPHAVCEEVLPKYFRHSKYSSFQRQLNYFGFKKTEGKGKMTPCVYSSLELQGRPLESILEMKRKINVMAPRHKGDKLDMYGAGHVSQIFDYPSGYCQGPPMQQPMIHSHQQHMYNPYLDPRSNASAVHQQRQPYDVKQEEPLFTSTSSVPRTAYNVPKTSLNAFELKFADTKPQLPSPRVTVSVSKTMPINASNYSQPSQTSMDQLGYHTGPAGLTTGKPLHPLDFAEGSQMLDSLIDEWVNSSSTPANVDQQITSESSTEDEEVMWENDENFLEDVALAFF